MLASDALLENRSSVLLGLALAPSLLITVTAIVYYLLALSAAVRFLQPAPPPNRRFEPPVTIVKPLHGVEPSTDEALSSFCELTYPCLQIIFAVRSAADPAVALVEQLIRRYPERDLALVISDHRDGTTHGGANHGGANPKVNNMAHALAQAKHSILVFADSDIWVAPDYLHRVVQPLQDPGVGLVTTMYRTRPATWIAAFEALATSTEFFPSVLVARQLEGMAFAFGATIVIRRRVLDGFGGLPLVSHYLADDFKLGQCTARSGFQVVLSEHVVDHALRTASFREMLQHQLRWARGNRFSRPWGTLGLVFTYGTLSSFVVLLLAGATSPAVALLLLTWGLRYALGWVVGVRLLQDAAAMRLLWLAPVRDLVSALVWLVSWFGADVTWGGRRLILTSGGRIRESRS
ncbi:MULTISPECIES: bacteriohopanetetrol glucosamine biosynthesis glycosyltransferase HpnI [Aphanothece]|uniref:bacteriohopanetetrol glucosamine biosynthesis glycosyltransferase HpnI n=1 Tax=Aphanothece TaxID=1121 RepID=UPI003984B947